MQKESQKIKKIGNYLLLEKIGSGASATVFKAKIKDTHEKVAVKQIAIQNLNEKALKRINQEFDILQKLKHDNVVKLIDMKKSDNHRYFIFEYCQYGDLDSYIKKFFGGKISERKAQQVIIQLSSALKLMQSYKIVHRDLKLANILVGKGFIVKIADFGFAKLKEDDSLMKSTLGTPITMGPEILEYKQYDEKCDIWSLGVIIYQMVYGKPPFLPEPGTGILGLKQRISKGIINFDGVNISEELKDLIKKMLVKDPNERMSFSEFFEHEWVTGQYQVWDEFEQDLEISLKEVRVKINQNTKNIEKKIEKKQQKQQQQKEQSVKQVQQQQIRKPKMDIILALKIQFELRKYLETNVVKFLAGLNSLKKYFLGNFDNVQQSEKQNYTEMVGIASLLLAYRISQFLVLPISLEFKDQTLNISNFKQFQGQFLVNGQNDVGNIALILQKKMAQLKNFGNSIEYSDCSKSIQYSFLQKIQQNVMQMDINFVQDSQLFKNQFYKKLQDVYNIAQIYEKNILPNNSLTINLSSEILSQDEIQELFNGLVQGRFYTYSTQLRNYRFYEEYKKYEDVFRVQVQENQDIIDDKVQQIDDMYDELLDGFKSLLLDD